MFLGKEAGSAWRLFSLLVLVYMWLAANKGALNPIESLYKLLPLPYLNSILFLPLFNDNNNRAL